MKFDLLEDFEQDRVMEALEWTAQDLINGMYVIAIAPEKFDDYVEEEVEEAFNPEKNEKIIRTLAPRGIVFVAHDESMFKRGKVGFAVTQYGVYTKAPFDSGVTFVSFEEIVHYDTCRHSPTGEYFMGDKRVAVAALRGIVEKSLMMYFEKTASKLREYFED